MARGPALVTGASSGLGRAFAESLAARGHPLVVVARRRERLSELADWAERTHGVSTRIVVADLATPEGLAACREEVDRGERPEVAVLNAGFGSQGSLWSIDRERQADMVRLNCVAVVDLAAHVLPAMVARGRGTLIVMSSAAAWQPVPFMATYAATKAFELHLAEALAEELRGTGVRAIAVCPGPTRTEFSMSAGGSTTPSAIPFDDPAMVVRATLRGLERRRSRVPTGVVARASLLAGRVLPRGAVVRIAALTHRRARPLKGFERRP